MKPEPAIEIYVRVNFGNGTQPPTFIANYPVGKETDIAKIIRHGLAKFQDERVPVKTKTHLHD